MKILYVCTGNICRSPLGEAITRHQAERLHFPVPIEVASAGTHGYHVGEKPDPRSVAVALRRGVSTEGQHARKLSLNDFETFDLILAMDRSHLFHMMDMAPAHTHKKIKLFMAHCCGTIEDVPDPYYGHMEDFEEVFNMIERGVSNLLRKEFA